MEIPKPIFYQSQLSPLQKSSNQVPQPYSTQIQNYYGAHNNFKTQFRNNRYKNVYTQLIHRRPVQSQHLSLYYQDLLISIIKSIQLCLICKDNVNQAIEPFFYFGTKSVRDYYWLFLKQNKIINNEVVINPNTKPKISNFFTLLIDFSSKISLFLAYKSDYQNSQKIFYYTYRYIVQQIIQSSTSVCQIYILFQNLLLLKKCSQFILTYVKHNVQIKNYYQVYEALKNGIKIELNQLILIKYCILNKKKEKKYIKKYIKILQLLVKYFVYYSILYQNYLQIYQCQSAISDVHTIQQLISYYNPKYNKLGLYISSYSDQKSQYLQLSRICHTYFKRQQLKELVPGVNNVQYRNQKQIHVCKRNRDGSKESKNGKGIEKGNKGQDGGGYKGNQSRKNTQRVFKEVRFKLATDGDQKTGHGIHKKPEHQISNSNEQFNKILKPSQNTLNSHSTDQLAKAKQVLYKKYMQQKKQYIKLSSSRSLIKIKNNDDNLSVISDHLQCWNQKYFWKPKSICANNLGRRQLQQKSPKVDYSNTSYILAKSPKTLPFTKQAYLKKIIGSNESTALKKRGKKKYSIVELAEVTIDSKQKINKKITEWHNKNYSIQSDILCKLSKLKQRKNIKNPIQKLLQTQQKQYQISIQQQNKYEINLIQNELQNKKICKYIGNYHQINKKIKGIRLFKNFILQNKYLFGIRNLSLFIYQNKDNNNNGNCQTKKYNSFTDVIPQTSKNIQKTYLQAKNNIQFFMRDIENSTKKLKRRVEIQNAQKLRKYHKNKCKYRQIGKNVEKDDGGEVGKQDGKEDGTSKLFVSSMKGRVEQMINYY